MELQGDGIEYDILFRAAKIAAPLTGLTCEIGLHMGGGTKTIIDAIKSSPLKHSNATHIAIDPYGRLPYRTGDGPPVEADYCNAMRDAVVPLLYSYAATSGVNFIFFNFSDRVFMEAFRSGVSTYNHGERHLAHVYSLVHFDGPHATLDVMMEAEFFEPRAIKGSVFVFDDIGLYDHAQVYSYLASSPGQWRPLERGASKASYIRER